MEDENLDGINDIDTTTTDTTVSESSTDNKAGEQDISQDSNEENDLNDLIQKLKDNDVPLNKIERFQKLSEKARKADTLEKELETLRSGAAKPATAGKPTETTSANPTVDYSDLYQTLDSLEDPTFSEPEYDGEGNYVQGGYKTYLEQYKAFRKEIFTEMNKVREIGEQQKAKQDAEVQGYYDTLQTDIKDAFIDDTGKLDEASYNAYMDQLKKDHATKPVDNVRKHLISYMRSSLRKNTETKTNSGLNNANSISGRTPKGTGSEGEYVPGQSGSWDSI